MCDDKGIDNCGDGSDLEENLTTGCKGQLCDGDTLIFKEAQTDFIRVHSNSQLILQNISNLSSVGGKPGISECYK